jgi:phenylalanyl-tRNA synthetase beta chain
VERDFAFIIEDSVVAENLVKAAMSADKKLITSVSVFDLFTDGALGDGKKSMAITVTLQPTDATLTDAEIEDISDKVVANVAKHTGGVLRG